MKENRKQQKRGKRQDGFSVPSRTEEGKIYIKQQQLKDSFEVKRYDKGLLVQIMEEEIYKILIDRAFTEDEDSPFEKMDPHKKFITQ